MRVPNRRASFWTSTAVVGHALWASAAPTVTYPLYTDQWHLTATATTSVFAVFPVALVATLIVFGDLADYIGRRGSILLGLTASLTGAALFAVAPAVGWVFAGRALMGLGVVLAMGPASAAVVEFSAKGVTKRASAITTAATAVGLALAVLSGGLLIDFGPDPIHGNFWILTAVTALVLTAAWHLPRHTKAEAKGSWQPRGLRVPRSLRIVFTTSAVAVTAGFIVGAVLLSLGAQIARELIGSADALVSGSVIALFATVMGAAAILVRNVRPRTSIMLGATGAITALGLLILAAAIHSLTVFLLFALTAGIGYSLLFTGGLGLLNAHAPTHHRAGALSALYLIAYLMQAVTALTLGAIATATDLHTAVNTGTPAIAAVSALAATLAALTRDAASLSSRAKRKPPRRSAAMMPESRRQHEHPRP
ncbi:MFS transporter [Streptomyces sp. S.PB5]|uniref:MFS transporter n=1 Tax=Streptomyces sp. S.PB5 TaxID=3020844 RepID=UPI0025AF7E19|nr:MFS transporter [Streptomyces sp. S.PB5]MDN3028347.1 MFS transporter [Streptomyces sp. S.PB5]